MGISYAKFDVDSDCWSVKTDDKWWNPITKTVDWLWSIMVKCYVLMIDDEHQGFRLMESCWKSLGIIDFCS